MNKVNPSPDLDIENPPTTKRINDINKQRRSTETHFRGRAISLHWKVRACYILPFLKAIAFEFRQVTLVALIEKLFRLALEQSLSSDLYEQVIDGLYGSILNSKTLRGLLLYDLSFVETFIVTASLVVVISVTRPLENALTADCLNYHEVKRLQSVVYDRLFFSPLTIDIEQANDLIYNNIPSVEKYWTDVKYKKVDDLTTIVVALVLIMVTAWDLGLIVIFGSIFVFLASTITLKKLSDPWREQLEVLLSKVSARLSDMLCCRDVILTHSMELREKETLHKMFQSDSQELKHLFRARIASRMIMMGGLVAIIPILLLIVFLNEITLARVFQVLLINILFVEIVNAFTRWLDYGHISDQYHRTVNSMCAVLQVDQNELFPNDFSCSLTNKSRSVPTSVEGTEASSLDSFDSLESIIAEAGDGKQLSLEHLELGYTRMDGSMATVIDDLSLSLSLGNHYGVMGESGAGKSTLFKLLSGLISPKVGTISVAGQVVDTTKRYWRDQVAVVSQDSILFNRSLRENLTYGLLADSASDDAILNALKQVNLEERILSLPEGLDTMIYENGNEFSGGQKQRLQVARLLLSQKPIILLDEMTSALDSESTQKVTSVLKEFCRHKTLFMITHDAETLALVDTVFDLKRGGKVEARRNRSKRPLKKRPLKKRKKLADNKLNNNTNISASSEEAANKTGKNNDDNTNTRNKKQSAKAKQLENLPKAKKQQSQPPKAKKRQKTVSDREIE